MKKNIFFILFVMTPFFVFQLASQADSQTPTKGPAQAIGDYTLGCLSGGQALESNGEGYVVVKTHRNHFYGHPDLIEILKNYGKKISELGLKPVQIGNLSLPRGGPSHTHHASHQTGLDVDIWFAKKQGSVLDDSQKKLNPEIWGKDKITLLKTMAEFPKVQRILVHPVIKKELCALTSEKWLHKIRPWWGHDDHFHVRLYCPQDSPNCVAQEEPSEGTDCGSEALEWWFSEEAEAMRLGKIKKARPDTSKQVLPQKCLEILEKKN